MEVSVCLITYSNIPRRNYFSAGTLDGDSYSIIEDNSSRNFLAKVSEFSD